MIKKNNFYFIVVYFVGLLLLLVFSNYKTPYVSELLTLQFSYFVIGGLFCIAFIKNKLDIFDPFFVVFILLLMIFSIAPIIFINNNIYTIHGINFMDGCVKTTIIYMLGSVAFYIGYNSAIKKEKAEAEEKKAITQEQNIEIRRKTTRWMLFIWLICFAIYLFYQIKFLGRSITYIFSLGKNGNLTEISDNPLKFLTMFGTSMIVPWLYILFNSEKTYLKIAITLLMSIVYLANGYRYLFVIMALSFFCIYCIKNNKNINILVLFSAACCGLAFFSVIGNIRSAIRNGNEYEFQLSNEMVLYTLQSNFNIYQPFYRIVEEYPKNYNYTLGEGEIFDTMITFLPRAIWKNKPLTRDYAINRAVRLSTNDWLIDTAGIAVPNIAEMYVDFGIFGVVVLMFIFGKILKNVALKYKKGTFSDMIIYSIVYGLCFQLVTRGYMASNFYLIIFMLWPVIVIRKIERSKINEKRV